MFQYWRNFRRNHAWGRTMKPLSPDRCLVRRDILSLHLLFEAPCGCQRYVCVCERRYSTWRLCWDLACTAWGMMSLGQYRQQCLGYSVINITECRSWHCSCIMWPRLAGQHMDSVIEKRRDCSVYLFSVASTAAFLPPVRRLFGTLLKLYSQ